MSAKLIVHKIENEHFKSLHICIERNENDETQAKFGAWIDGKAEVKNKDLEKSRLQVKVASEIEPKTLNLDSCANEIKEKHVFNMFCDLYNDDGKEIDFSADKIGGNKILENQQLVRVHDSKSIPWNYMTDNITSELQYDTKFQSPLEYSLEKVKENNARIMEKIHILNRTLNFTKKKEIFDTMNLKPFRSYPCSECEKCFVYETGLRRHFFLRHGNIDNLPRWQTVWTCTECFQVWPSQNTAISHSKYCCKQNSTDVVREIKTSLLLQCEFCEKVFTCIPRLLRHFKHHTIKYNYECNGCSIAFVSYKSAEQHWLQCPWLKINYTFSLPKMLLCNTCDRKFRNYEQLYNHRYKVCHFMGKSIDNNEDLLNLVYQCETCSQWFIETSLLEAHRNEQHPRFDNAMTL